MGISTRDVRAAANNIFDSLVIKKPIKKGFFIIFGKLGRVHGFGYAMYTTVTLGESSRYFFLARIECLGRPHPI